MSNIKPFKAVFYNRKKIKDLGTVVCPPYDVISEEEQDALHALSEYNFTHIDLGKDNPDDTKSDNKYTRAKSIFEEWLEKEIIVQDEDECIYFYRQEYKVMGQKYGRMGFICAMKLQDEEDSKVYPHENTHDKAVNDRLSLCKSLNSHLSSIFVCYSDKQKKIEKIFNKKVSVNAPMQEVVDNDGVQHKMWRLSDPSLIKEIDGSLGNQHLFIADGHHRYKVSLEYRKSCMAKQSNVTGDEPFNYVMTYFTNIDSKELKIFPMHRIVKNLPKKLSFLEDFFRIDKIKSIDELPIVLGRAGKNEHAFVLYTKDGIQLLRLKNKMLIDKYVKEGSKAYKSLDATILKCLVFDKVGVESKDIIYTKDQSLAINMVDDGDADASFIMNAVKIDELKEIALNGERMPPKTTYFYPKVLSGLTVYKMD